MNAELNLVGQELFWEFKDTDSQAHHKVRGVLLGSASSQRVRHEHHHGKPCSACRWFEVRIVRNLDDPGDYLVSFEGFTVVTGETHRCTVHRTLSAHTVLELLTQVRGGETFIPRTSRLALSEAAAHDEEMERAWIDRAIA